MHTRFTEFVCFRRFIKGITTESAFGSIFIFTSGNVSKSSERVGILAKPLISILEISFAVRLEIFPM